MENQINEALVSYKEQEERQLYDTYKLLSNLKYETKLSPSTIDLIVEAIKHGLTKDYSTFRPFHSLFITISELAPLHAKELATIQDEITYFLNDDIYDYDDFTSALYFFQQSWGYLGAEWSAENKAAIIKNLIDIIEDEYETDESFDAFVADDVSRALEVIGKDDAKAQEIVKWVEKVVEEQDDEEDYDDEDEE